MPETTVIERDRRGESVIEVGKKEEGMRERV